MKFHIVFLLLFVISCGESKDNPEMKKHANYKIFKSEIKHGRNELKLFNNKTFEYFNEIAPELGYSKIFGKYTKVNSVINLNPDLCLECTYIDYNITSKCDTIKFNKLKYPVKTKFFKFSWKNKYYLLSDENDNVYNSLHNLENDFQVFIKDYNNKYTPKYSRYLTSEIDSVINTSLPIDSFPIKFRNSFIKF